MQIFYLVRKILGICWYWTRVPAGNKLRSERSTSELAGPGSHALLFNNFLLSRAQYNCISFLNLTNDYFLHLFSKNPEFWSANNCPYFNIPNSESTCYGDEILTTLDNIAENDNRYDEEKLLKSVYEKFGKSGIASLLKKQLLHIFYANFVRIFVSFFGISCFEIRFYVLASDFTSFGSKKLKTWA